MEETNSKHLMVNEEIMKEMKSESEDKDNVSNVDDDKSQHQVVIKTEREVCLSARLSNMDESITSTSAIERNSMEKSIIKTEKCQSDDKECKSNENSVKNRQQIDLKDGKDEMCHSITLSNLNESSTKKRKKDEFEGLNIGDEILSTKKIKSEDNRENQQQTDDQIREKEETYILGLFTDVLNTIMKRKNLEDEEISERIQLMKNSFKHDPGENITFHDTDFTQWENICAYLFRYGAHGAGFARYRILNAIRNCKEVENALKKPDLKIISLGSGPGNDAVGFCSALSELQYPKSLKMTLVDKFEEWEECIDLAINFIEANTEKDGKVRKFFQRTNIETQFIQTELPGDSKSDEKYFKVLGEADVIVLSKFFTSLDRKNYGEIERAIINSLHEHVKKDAVILVNDILIEERWSNFHQVYKWPLKEDEYVYSSIANASERFRCNNDVKSKLPIYVFIKNIPEVKSEQTIIQSFPERMTEDAVKDSE